MRRYQTGHRSSVSTGGKLEYPELEIIPGGELAFVMNEVRELKRERARSNESRGSGSGAAQRSSSWGEKVGAGKLNLL